MRSVVFLLFLLSPAVSSAASEVIAPFRLQSCVADKCVEVKAARATRGYLSKIYFMEGPIVFRAEGQEMTMSDGYYDPRASFIMIRDGSLQEIGVSLDAGKIIRFGG